MKQTLRSCIRHPLSQSRALAATLLATLFLGLPALQAATITAVSPAKNATGVSTTASVVFTFSVALDPDSSAVLFMDSSTPLDTENVWSAGNTVLTCTPTEAWPADTVISWTVAGLAAGGGFDFVSDAGLFTTGTGGGTVDTTPPTLTTAFPVNGATAVPINSTIRFTFNEAMQASQSINWSANLTPASVSYSWSTDARTLSCDYATDLPANATITWALNPSAAAAQFKDAAGNPLAVATYAGSFQTSNTSTNDPCNPQPDLSRGGVGLFKTVSYDQSGAGAPTELAEDPALFGASVSSPTNNPITAAQVQPPSGAALPLTGFMGNFFLGEPYASQTALDAARPAGTYTVGITRQTGGIVNIPLTLGAADWPPTPQILNLPALQTAGATADIVVQWNSFTGAGSSDSIFFSVGSVFEAPDPCVPRPLANTATSVTIPANTLQTGQIYEATLSFTRISDTDSNSVPDIGGILGLTKDVTFTINTGGGSTPGAAARLSSVVLLPNGDLEFLLTGDAAKSYTIEASATVPSTQWTEVQTLTIPAGGSTLFNAGTTTSGTRFLRVRSN